MTGGGEKRCFFLLPLSLSRGFPPFSFSLSLFSAILYL